MTRLAEMPAVETPIYIVGRRHSGTTFLDVALGSCEQIESLGEIVTGLHNGSRETLASGDSLESSAFWSAAIESYRIGPGADSDRQDEAGADLLADGAELYRLSSITRFPAALIASLQRSARWSGYHRLNRAVMDTLSRTAGGKRILDSNKEYTRGLMFLKGYPHARVLHMVRNPVPIAGSHYYRVHEKGMPVGFMKRHFEPGALLFPVLMITVGLSWTVGILAATVLKLRYPGRVLDVSYERFCLDPAGELDRIGRFLDVDLSAVAGAIERREALSVNNNVGGNELKLDGSFTFVANADGRRHLPLAYRWGIHAIAAPGYALRKLFARFD